MPTEEEIQTIQAGEARERELPLNLQSRAWRGRIFVAVDWERCTLAAMNADRARSKALGELGPLIVQKRLRVGDIERRASSYRRAYEEIFADNVSLLDKHISLLVSAYHEFNPHGLSADELWAIAGYEIERLIREAREAVADSPGLNSLAAPERQRLLDTFVCDTDCVWRKWRVALEQEAVALERTAANHASAEVNAPAEIQAPAPADKRSNGGEAEPKGKAPADASDRDSRATSGRGRPKSGHVDVQEAAIRSLFANHRREGRPDPTYEEIADSWDKLRGEQDTGVPAEYRALDSSVTTWRAALRRIHTKGQTQKLMTARISRSGVRRNPTK